MFLSYDPVAKLLIDAIQSLEESGERIAIWRVLIRLYYTSPSEAILPRLLRDERVWPAIRRLDVLEKQESIAGDVMSFGQFATALDEVAMCENAPVISECHFARVLANNESAFRTLVRAGIDRTALLRRMDEVYGFREPSDDDKRKTWCVCDSNFFLHYQSFTDPSWRGQLHAVDLVFVVAAAIVRELDDLKFHRSGQTRTQARITLREFKRVAIQSAPGCPAPAGEGVELLLLGREARAFPAGLDPSVADDHLIATAYDFRWRHRGLKVALLSGDVTVHLKAREYGLEFIEVPECMEIEPEVLDAKHRANQLSRARAARALAAVDGPRPLSR